VWGSTFPSATATATTTTAPKGDISSATPTINSSSAAPSASSSSAAPITPQAETTAPSSIATSNPISPVAPIDVSAGSDPVFVEDNGLIVVEAESILLTSGDDSLLWQRETDLDGFYGDSFVRFTGNSPSNGKPDGRRSLYFLISHPGQYQLAIRSWKNNTQHDDYSNDCYSRLIGAEGFRGIWTKTYNGFKPNVWTWSTTHYPAKRFDMEPMAPVYNLTQAPAVYELQLAGRSQHYRMDRIVLFHEDLVARGFAQHRTRSESARLTEAPSVSPTAAPTLVPTTSEPSQRPSAVPSASPTTDPPTGAPTFSLAPTVSAAPTHPPTFVSNYFVDAGSSTEDASLWKANKGDRTVYRPGIDIVGAEPFADAEVFRSHRWSAKLTYTFPRLEPGSLFNVTLGFSEMYWCNNQGGGTVGSRIFDANVNDETMLEQFDVLEHTGARCHTAHYESTTTTASNDGSITIQFFSIVDRAMVSLIEVSLL